MSVAAESVVVFGVPWTVTGASLSLGAAAMVFGLCAWQLYYRDFSRTLLRVVGMLAFCVCVLHFLVAVRLGAASGQPFGIGRTGGISAVSMLVTASFVLGVFCLYAALWRGADR